MKFVLMLSLMISNFAFAAENTSALKMEHSTHIKPYIGLGAFNITGTSQDFSSRGGVAAGAVGQWSTSIPGLQIESGLEYIQAGAEREYIYVANGTTAIKEEYELHYIAIPIKGTYQIMPANTENPVSYKVLGGVTVAQLLSAKGKTNLFGVKDEFSVTSELNSTDVLASIGAGADYDVLGGKVNLEAEYVRGLMEVMKEGGGHNEGFILRAGYSMPL